MWDKAMKGDTRTSPCSGPPLCTDRGCCVPQLLGCPVGCKGHPISEWLLLGVSTHLSGPSTVTQKEQIIFNSISFV